MKILSLKLAFLENLSSQTLPANNMVLNKTSLNNLLNVAFFQGVWFLTVIGVAQGNLWWGIGALTSFVIVHHYSSDTAGTDFQVAVLAIAIGAIVETLFIRSGLLVYEYNLPAANFAPIWILILWANLALTLNGCLRWLHGRYLLAAALGAAGGPLSYFGGIKLGAATAGASMSLTLGVIAMVYACITPFLLMVARRLANASTHENY